DGGDGEPHVVGDRRSIDRYQLVYEAHDARRRLRRDAALLALRQIGGASADLGLPRSPHRECDAVRERQIQLPQETQRAPRPLPYPKPAKILAEFNGAVRGRPPGNPAYKKTARR